MRHVGDEIEPGREPHVTQVLTVNQNCAGGRIHIAHEKAHDGRLAGARGTNQSGFFAGLNGEADISENRRGRLRAFDSASGHTRKIAFFHGVGVADIAHLHAHTVVSPELNGIGLVGDVGRNRQRKHGRANRRHVPVNLMFEMADMPDALADFGGVHQERHEDAVGPIALPNQPGSIAQRAQKNETVGVSTPGDLVDEPQPEFTLFAEHFFEAAILVSDLGVLFRTGFYALDFFPALMLPAVDTPEFFVERHTFLGNVAVQIDKPDQVACEQQGHEEAS